MGTRVLVHGLGGLPSSWARVVDAGSDEIKHHMLCLPGHGAVAPGKENATFAGIADSLWAQLTLSPEERVHLVGYSLGARMAMAMSARRPDRVARLSLIAGHPGLRDEGERAQRRQWDGKWARVLQDEGTAAFVREWEQPPLFQSQTRLGSAVRAEHSRGAFPDQLDSLGRSLD